MIEKLTAKKLREYNFKEETIKKLIEWDNYTISYQNGIGSFFATNIEKKIYSGIDALRIIYFHTNFRPSFPVKDLNLVPEYFELVLTQYLSKQKTIAGNLFNKTKAIEKFINEEKQRTIELIENTKTDALYKRSEYKQESVQKREWYLHWLEEKRNATNLTEKEELKDELTSKKKVLELFLKYLPHGLLYEFDFNLDLIKKQATENEIIREIIKLEQINQKSFLESLQSQNEKTFANHINIHFLYFKTNLKDRNPYLINYWLTKTEYLIKNSKISSVLKDLFENWKKEIYFPKSDNLKNWRDTQYIYNWYLGNITLDNSIETINHYSSIMNDCEFENICHRAKVELTNAIHNSKVDKTLIKNELNSFVEKYYSYIKYNNIKIGSEQPSYIYFFKTFQPLIDLKDWFFSNVLNDTSITSEKTNKKKNKSETDTIILENNFNPSFWNEKSYNLFLYLSDNYLKKGNVKYINIYYFIRDISVIKNSDYRFDIIIDEYKKIILSKFKINIKKFARAQFDYEDKQLPKLRDLEKNYRQLFK